MPWRRWITVSGYGDRGYRAKVWEKEIRLTLVECIRQCHNQKELFNSLSA